MLEQILRTSYAHLLICQYISNRIISHIPGDNASFDLQWGPLTEKDLDNWLLKPSSTATESSNSKRRRDTLVVNDIDRFYPPLADWMYNTFHFLPNWRMDDGQISLSELGGGIGPHVDNYDVFLIQMSGRRTWQVGRRKISAVEEQDRMIAGLDVRVLDDWSLDSAQDGQAEVEEWIVEPGDVLYLPPRVAHCGTSLTNDSMTLSVGCRAPSVSDLVSKLAESLTSSIDDSAVRRYTDHDILQGGGDDSESSPGELTSDAKESAKRLVLNSLASLLNDDERWDEFFGRYVTEQKRLRNNYPIPLLEDLAYEDDGADSFTVDANAIVEDTLSGKCALYQAEGIAFAYSSTPSKVQRGRVSHRFFVNGEMWQSTSNDEEQSCLIHIYQAVANHRRLDQSILLGTNDNKLSSQAISFLEELVDIGVLYNM